MTDLKILVEDGVAVLTLNRPERRNAFTIEMIEAIADFVDAAGTDESCRAIVLTGAGGAFCAGVDMEVAQALREGPQSGKALAWKNLLFEHVHKVALALQRCDLPVIAAVDGPAYGAGMDLALMCDMRFASSAAVFCEAYINLGVVPGDGGCWYLPRIVGMAKALELLLGGERVGAQEALGMGLVNRVYSPEELLDKTVVFARLLASKSPLALRMTKRTAIQSATLDLRTSLDLISSHMGVVQTAPQTEAIIGATIDAHRSPGSRK